MKWREGGNKRRDGQQVGNEKDASVAADPSMPQNRSIEGNPYQIGR